MTQLSRPDLAQRNRDSAKHGHAGARTATYISWKAMRDRILNTASKDFPGWGGRGLDIDPRWNDYTVFLADLGDRPPGTTLGRVNNDRGYWPDNCQWESPTQQGSNRRQKTAVEFQGKNWTVAALARAYGLHKCTLAHRLRAGWSISDALTVAPTHRNRHRLMETS